MTQNNDLENENPNVTTKAIEETRPNSTADETRDSGNGAGVSPLVCVLLTIAVTCMSLFAYHKFMANKAQKFAVVDIQKLTASFENEARRAIVENLDATDADREAAAARYESRMMGLQKAIKTVGDECDCVLLVKAVSLNNEAGRLTDLTKKVHGLVEGDMQEMPAETMTPALPKAPAALPKPTETEKSVVPTN